uniref:Reverse transcriptase domain-containing protein n=1 Tax=Thelazia callipaeda TaxID=103827 RepID=A0A0N5CS90_THECL
LNDFNLFVRNPCFADKETISSLSLTEVEHLDTVPFNYDKEVAIIQIVDDELALETVNFVQTEIQVMEEITDSQMLMAVATSTEYVDETNEDVSSEAPSSSTRSISPIDCKVPRNFREKKEMYGRNAPKLFETYREEWERIAHLSDRRRLAASPSRRKSILLLTPKQSRPRESSNDRGDFHNDNSLINGHSKKSYKD